MTTPGTGHRRQLTLRIRHGSANLRAYSASFSTGAIVSELHAAICHDLGLEPTTTVLRDPALGAELATDELLTALQLRHGQILAVEAPRAQDLLAPALRESDALRIVHESGPQLGFAWPVAADYGQIAWTVDLTAGMMRPAATLPQADILASYDPVTFAITLVIQNADLLVSVNGTRITERFDVSPGGIVRVAAAEGTVPIELRILIRAEHDQTRSFNSTVTYRVRPSDVQLTEVIPQQVRVTAPTAQPAPKFDWVDVTIQEASMLAIYAFLIARTGFSWIILVFLFLPFGRLYVRWRRHRDDTRKQRQAEQESIAAFHREMGVLADQVKLEAQVIARRNPSLLHMSDVARARARELWQRNPSRDSFLRVTIGRGPYRSPSNAEIVGDRTDQRLADWRADAENVRVLYRAPVEIDLKSENFAVIGPTDEMHEFVADLVLRLCLQHSPAHLSIACLLPSDPVERANLAWLRWLPHTSVITDLFAGHRFVAGPSPCRDAIGRSTELIADALPGDGHLVLIVHEAAGVDAGELTRYQAASKGRVHVVWIGNSISRLPAAIAHGVELAPRPFVRNTTAGRYFPADDEMVCTLLDLPSADSLAAEIAPLTDEDQSQVSQAISQMVGLGSISSVPDSDTTEWLSPRESLISSLGQDGFGVFHIDMVDHGPHVLIAGTTGSGKSELLRSLVLSLAANYRPEHLVFILIDFKGGASLGDLAAMAHNVGMVSNLDPIDVDRLIRFLTAEVERRQSELAAFGGEYVEYFPKIALPMPRLVVVIDEFGGFVNEADRAREAAILNIASRGRSLGIHLVIATQSPRGVVTPQVRANVNARIALRMLEDSDSDAVLDTSDAARRIPRALQGRAFARFESGQLLQFQGAFTRSKLLERGTEQTLDLVPFDPVSAAQPTSTSSANQEKSPTDARRIIDAVKDLPAPDPEVQPRLKPSLTMRTHRDAAGQRTTQASPSTQGNLFFGIRDEPERQRQEQGFVNLDQGGLLVTGSAASGRTRALAALAVDFVQHNQECQLVVIDCGGGDLIKLIPSSSWTIDGPDLPQTMQLLAQLDEDYGALTAPVLLVIDRIDVLQDVIEEPTRLARHIAGGARRAVYVVASNDSRLTLDTDLRRAFRHRYAMLENHAGIAADLEANGSLIQVADPELGLLNTEHLQRQRSDESWFARFPVRRNYEQRGGWRPLRPPEPSLPAPSEADLAEVGLVVGTDAVRHETVSVRLGAGFAIAGGPGSGRTSTLLTIGERLARRTGQMIPVIAGRRFPTHDRESSAWWVDVIDLWHAEWSKRKPEEHVDIAGYVDALYKKPRIAPVLLIDDVDQLDSHLGFLDDLGGYRLAMTNALATVIKTRRIRLTASLPLSTLLESYGTYFGEKELNYRNQVISLQPTEARLLQTAPAMRIAINLLANMDGRQYQPGEGAYVSRGIRQEVTVHRGMSVPGIMAHFDSQNEHSEL